MCLPLDSEFLQKGISNMKKPYVPDFGYEGAAPEILFGSAKKGWALIADSILSFPRLQRSSKVIKRIAKKTSLGRKSLRKNRMTLNLYKVKPFNRSLDSSLGSPVRPKTEMETFSFKKIARISPEVRCVEPSKKPQKPVKKLRLKRKSKKSNGGATIKGFLSRSIVATDL